MVNPIHSRLALPPRTPTWSLDHEKCTTAELQKFLEERTGVKLTEGHVQKVRDHGSYPLIDRLRQMDRESTFPRFMELPPELRLGVYEALLVVAEGTPKQDGVPRLHPAVLRTSKQVYLEAMPVLYKQNKFRAEIMYCEQLSRPRRSGNGITPFCALFVHQPGRGHSFYPRMDNVIFSILRRLFDHHATMHMLRMPTYLTLDIYLVTQQSKQESQEYSVKACNTMKSLCLALAGGSKLKELTIVVKAGDQDSSDVDLADILWSPLLLHSDIKLKFEGITADPKKSSTTECESSAKVDTAFRWRIALIRQTCNSEFEKPGLEQRCWAFHGIPGNDVALYALRPPGKWLCLDDIINVSPIWKTIRREIDPAKVLDSE